MFHGTVHFRCQDFIVNEIQGEESIVGKYTVGFDWQNYAKIFVMGIKEEGSGIQRPVVFDTELECKEFLKEMYFREDTLRCIEITREIFQRDIFPKNGAYHLKKTNIFIPTVSLR